MLSYAQLRTIVDRWGIQLRVTWPRNLTPLVYGLIHGESGCLSAFRDLLQCQGLFCGASMVELIACPFPLPGPFDRMQSLAHDRLRLCWVLEMKGSK